MYNICKCGILQIVVYFSLHITISVYKILFEPLRYCNRAENK